MKTCISTLLICFVAAINLHAQIFVPSKKITYEFLSTLLKGDGYVIKGIGKNYLSVSKNNHNPINIDISADRKFIVLNILYGIKQSVESNKVNKLIERINVLGNIKASVSKQYDIITLEYYFWITDGMSVENFIAATNMFYNEQFEADTEWDEESIIQ
jgi:hypothetical protein